MLDIALCSLCCLSTYASLEEHLGNKSGKDISRAGLSLDFFYLVHLTCTQHLHSLTEPFHFESLLQPPLLALCLTFLRFCGPVSEGNFLHSGFYTLALYLACLD